MEAVRNILEDKLKGNDINIAKMIIEYITEECNFCEEVCFSNELDRVNYPYAPDCKSINKDQTLQCNNCKESNVCKACEDYACGCNKCDNREYCDDTGCCNVFCYDCSKDYMLYCNSCEKSFCCKKMVRFIGTDMDYNYSCEKCLDMIYPHY